jgi:hypothetical protein
VLYINKVFVIPFLSLKLIITYLHKYKLDISFQHFNSEREIIECLHNWLPLRQCSAPNSWLVKGVVSYKQSSFVFVKNSRNITFFIELKLTSNMLVCVGC